MDDRTPPVRVPVALSSDNDDDDRFLDDPLLPAFCAQDQDDYFSLGLVVNWPSTTTTTNIQYVSETEADAQTQRSYNAANYERFIAAVETECFFRGRTDFLFFLPFHALHITIATLFPACKLSELHADLPMISTEASKETKEEHTDDDAKITADAGTEASTAEALRSTVATRWKQVVQRASSSHDWPKRPLELELDAAEIRNRAGIFLWKEHTGGIAQMRRCLQAAVHQVEAEEGLLSSSASFLRNHLRIPDIIHTTFLRYHGFQKTCGTHKNVDANVLQLRPSEAHSLLIEKVVPNQPLFLKSGNPDHGDCAENEHHYRTGTGRQDSTANKAERVVLANVAKLVDCKIYLLGPRNEKDHQVFFSSPLQDLSSLQLTA